MAFWVETQARRANRNLLWTNGLIVAALLATVAVQYQYSANFVLGCARVDPSEIAGLTSATQRWRNFVTVRGSKSASTGYQDTIKHVEKSSGRVIFHGSSRRIHFPEGRRQDSSGPGASR